MLQYSRFDCLAIRSFCTPCAGWNGSHRWIIAGNEQISWLTTRAAGLAPRFALISQVMDTKWQVRKTRESGDRFTSRRLKSARYQASYVGPDLRRHFAPVTFDSKMIAERWLGKERERIEKAAASDEGLGGVETARSHDCSGVAAVVPSGKRKQVTEE